MAQQRRSRGHLDSDGDSDTFDETPTTSPAIAPAAPSLKGKGTPTSSPGRKKSSAGHRRRKSTGRKRGDSLDGGDGLEVVSAVPVPAAVMRMMAVDAAKPVPVFSPVEIRTVEPDTPAPASTAATPSLAGSGATSARKKKGKRRVKKPAAAAAATTSSTALKCAVCGASLKPAMKFCNKCGSAVSVADEAAHASEEDESDQEVEVRKKRPEEQFVTLVTKEIEQVDVEMQRPRVFSVKATEPEFLEEEIIEEEIIEEELPPSPPRASGKAALQASSTPIRVHLVDVDGEAEADKKAAFEKKAARTLSPLTRRVELGDSDVEDDDDDDDDTAHSSVDTAPSSVSSARPDSDAQTPRTGLGAMSPKMEEAAGGSELEEMSRFFAKHRLTRERLESSAALLLDKLKMLKETKATPVFDASEWEGYNVADPLFPFLALAGEARHLYVPRSVDVLKGPPEPLVFLRDYVSANVPCVIRGALTHWKASAAVWTNQYLTRVMGDDVVSVECTPEGKGDFVLNGRFVMPAQRRMRLRDVLSVLETGRADLGNLYVSFQNGNFSSQFAPLKGDVDAHLAWASAAFGCMPEVTNIWIGDGKAFTSCHKDHYENVFCVVTGEKHFTLLPPTDYPFLYERSYPSGRFTQDASSGKWRVVDDAAASKVPWISVNPDAPDLKEFPLFAHASPIRVTVKAGECLYLPSLWYHQVTQTPDAEGRCISINYWYDMKYDARYNYRNFLVNAWKLYGPAQPQ